MKWLNQTLLNILLRNKVSLRIGQGSQGMMTILTLLQNKSVGVRVIQNAAYILQTKGFPNFDNKILTKDVIITKGLLLVYLE